MRLGIFLFLQFSSICMLISFHCILSIFPFWIIRSDIELAWHNKLVKFTKLDLVPVTIAQTDWMTKLSQVKFQVERRYNHYWEQMQMVVNSFDMVMGFRAAAPYTTLAQKAMSRHFRCLKDAVAMELRSTCERLGEKDAFSSSGITKGETPRLKLLDERLRQQRAFHQLGMTEQEAWRPQRGLPECSVNILRSWLFEHFLHP